MLQKIETTLKILPGQSPYCAVIYFIDGNKFRQRSDRLSPFLDTQLSDLLKVVKDKTHKYYWRRQVWKVQIFDNTGVFQESLKYEAYRYIDRETGIFSDWHTTKKTDKKYIPILPGEDAYSR